MDRSSAGLLVRLLLLQFSWFFVSVDPIRFDFAQVGFGCVTIDDRCGLGIFN
jgi:hypothetical protein